MRYKRVSPSCCQTIKLFEPFIYGLLPTPYSLCQFLFFSCHLYRPDCFWAQNVSRSFPDVTVISFDTFAAHKHIFQSHPKYFDIVIKPTWVGPVHPNNISAHDRYSNFISDARSFEFVPEPVFIGSLLSLDLEVCSVDSDQAISPDMSFKSVLPINLNKTHTTINNNKQ